ncbi:peptidoglycan DD-metalloendopeptidase family protein [Leptolyngbya sp. FACHB-261]|nr:peptidoglycan DD-metalloendopeptidase family protein [Leptolyngbya sp. FACHB-261]
MGNNRWRWLLALLLVLLLSCLSWKPVSAQSLKQLRERQQSVEQQRQSVQQQRQSVQQQEKPAQQLLNNLKTNIRATDSQIKDNEYRLAQAEQQLQDLLADLKVYEERYEQQRLATVARLRYLQRQQSGRWWTLLLASRNLNEFLDRRYQLRLLYGADRQILSDLTRAAAELNRRKTVIERQKNQIALLTQELLGQKAQLQAQAAAQTETVNRLANDRQALEAAETQLAEESAALTGLIQRRVAAEQSRTGGPIVRGTGQLALPTDAPLTSYFGWRVHPILGYRRFHAGIDFGSAYGSTIRAADNGTVIFAGWYGGYGNAVVIDHGGGLTTLYGHCSALYVGEGQGVAKGQPIAAAGSTGLSTGPHLHFEVRVNGSPVDPLGYL